MIPLGLILGIAVASSVQVGTNQVLLTNALKGFDGAQAVSVSLLPLLSHPLLFSSETMLIGGRSSMRSQRT